MKHECDVVRDLMPLCIDDTASGKTREMVDEHVAECKPCEQVYGEMKSAVDIPAPKPRENPEFERAVRRMKTHRKRRTWLTLLLGVVLTMVVAVAVFCGYFWYFVDVVPLDTGSLSVLTSNDGIALIRAYNVPRSASMQLWLSEMVYPESAKGQYEVRVTVYSTRYEARHKGGGEIYFVAGNVAEGCIIMEDTRWDSEAQVYRMVYGKTDGSGKVFYLAGEEELEAVSLKGVSLKSPEAVAFVSPGSRAEAPYGTSTPEPNRRVDIFDSGSVLIRDITGTPIPTATPTIMPAVTTPTETLPATTLTPTPEL